MYEYEPQQSQVDFENNYNFSFPENFKKKLDIKRTANIIGFSLVVLTLISFFWADLYYFITGKIGISPQEAYEIISRPEVLSVVQIVVSTILFTLPFILLVKINGLRVDSLVPLKKVRKKEVLPYFFIGLFFCAFANISTSIASSIFDSFGVDYNVDFGENPRGVLGFLLSLISTAIIPALVEEFAFRGIVLSLLKGFGDKFAIITSAVLFGLVHGNFEQIPFAFLVGLGLGFITVKTNSLFIAMAVHSANNLISVIFDYLNLSPNMQNVIYIIYLMICILLGILVISKHFKEEDFSLSEEDETLSESKKYKWFFLSPAIIIFCVLSIAEAILYFL